MALTLSKFVTKRTVTSICALSTLIWILKRRNRKQVAKYRNIWPVEDIQYIIKEEKPKGPKAHVNARFFRQLYQLLKIGIPSIISSEFAFVLLIAGILITKSFCDLWMINMSTLIESSILKMDKSLFKRRLLKFLAVLPMISIVNNVLKYSIYEMKLRLRTNITRSLLDQYLK
uniref:ATP-binding cassette sub-family D member 3 n=1 Tax=Apis cerana TaxID=7461 RepID=V9IAU9_APICE